MTNLPQKQTKHHGLLASCEAELVYQLQEAKTLIQSGLLPSDFARPAAVIAAASYAKSLGLPPLQALLGSMIWITPQGKVALSSSALQALALRHGAQIEYPENTQDACTCVVTRNNIKYEVRWTLKDAEQAGLLGKTKSGKDRGWQKYARQRLRARAASEAIKMACPDILAGMVFEEIDDAIEEEEKIEKIEITKTKKDVERKISGHTYIPAIWGDDPLVEDGRVKVSGFPEPDPENGTPQFWGRDKDGHATCYYLHPPCYFATDRTKFRHVAKKDLEEYMAGLFAKHQFRSLYDAVFFLCEIPETDEAKTLCDAIMDRLSLDTDAFREYCQKHGIQTLKHERRYAYLYLLDASGRIGINDAP